MRFRCRHASVGRLRILVTREATSPAMFGIWPRHCYCQPTCFAQARSDELRARRQQIPLPSIGKGQGKGAAPATPQQQTRISGSSSASETQLDAIFAHDELIHIRRRDPAAAFLQLLAQLLWWFHPLVWWANRKAQRKSANERVTKKSFPGLGCRPAITRGPIWMCSKGNRSRKTGLRRARRRECWA